MWRWAVLWQASTLLLVGATFDLRFFAPRRQFAPSAQVNCFEYNPDSIARTFDKGLRTVKRSVNEAFPATMAPTFPTNPMYINAISNRIDHLLPDGNDIVKEHAKLVQDINSLRQVLFIPPIGGDENRDYEDSIFHEIIETSTTTTPRPTTARSVRPTKSIPVLLAGGASQRQVVKSQPIKFPKPTISLVGTSISPLMKHPYPFVMAASAKKPVKVCMTTLPMPLPMMYLPTTPRPSLWQRLLGSLIPR